MNIFRNIVVILLVVMTSGCVSRWARVDESSQHYKGKHFSVTLPADWMKIESNGTLVLSRDGPDLQRIFIQHMNHHDAFETLEKSSSPMMLPSELAELTLAELKAGRKGGFPSLKVLRNEPANIAGHTGFELHLSFKTDKGLRIEMLIRGFVDEKGFYVLLYRAPTLHYFKRDLPAFEMVIRSFRV